MADGCLVLDFDGTILDTERSRFQTWVDLWSEHAHELTLAEWQRSFGTDDLFDPWGELERRVGSPLDPSLRIRRRSRQNELQAEYGPRPGVMTWLLEARDLNVPVGIASSAPIEWVEANLEMLGIRSFFSTLVCRDDEIPAKPEPISYLLACERLGSEPSRSVVVEDSPNGVAAASTAGLFTVAVPHALTEGLDLSSADVVLPTLPCLEGLTLSDALTRASSIVSGDSHLDGPFHSEPT